MTLKRPTQPSNEKQKIDKRVERNTQSAFALWESPKGVSESGFFILFGRV